MKNKLLLVLMLLLFTGASQAQWQSDVRLTIDPAVSYTSPKSIATSWDVVHVVWQDNRDGNFEIYYKRSTDGGSTWGADTRLTNNSFVSMGPSVSVSSQVVHVVWNDGRDGNNEIYYKSSTDEGVSWGTDTRLTNNSFVSERPSVSVSGQVVHVVWNDGRDGNNEIYYKSSTDEGLSWGTDTRLTNNSFVSERPSVSVSGSIVHVVWEDYRDGNDEIYYKRSADGGVSWGADTRLTNDPSYSFFPSVSVSGAVVHIVWYDYRDGNFEIYYKCSTDAGVSWGADIRLTSNFATSYYPSVSVLGQAVHAVWNDGRDGNNEIYYKRSTDEGVSWGADTRLTNNAFSSMGPNVSVSGSVVHVVWQDNRDGNSEIYYKRDPTGNSTGINIISSLIPKVFSLSQNYPNPFNPTTKIRFDVPKTNFVTLTIYDILGREVTTLVNEQLQLGTYEVEFDGTNYTSGVYFYTLQTESFSETKRMVLIK